MPYFVFSVKPFGQIEKLAEFGTFAQASAHAKALRAQLPGSGVAPTQDPNAAQADASTLTYTLRGRAAPARSDEPKVKVMFAQTEELAIELLCQAREPGPLGDD
jgi:hypothetical protein